MKLNLKALLLFFVVLTTFSCSKDDLDNNNPTNPPNEAGGNPLTEIQRIENEAIASVVSADELNASVLISVKDQSGMAVSGASVTVSEQNLFTTDGVVVFQNIPLNSDFVGIKVAHPNFITAIKNFTPTEAIVYNLEVTLFEGEQENISATEGAELSFNSGVTLDFQPNSFVTAQGAAFNGEVTVNTYYHTESDPNYLAAQPGALVGLDGEELSALVTEGMLTVDLSDAAGNEVYIAEGQSVQVTMPAAADAPATIDLWHLNEKYGIWVKTGTATKVGQVYEFEVTHFSTYNLDVQVDALEAVSFRVLDSNSIVVNNIYFQVLIDGAPWALINSGSNIGFTLLNAPRGEYQLRYVTCGVEDVIVSNVVSVTTEGDFEFQLNTGVSSNTPFKYVTLQGGLANCENRFSENDLVTLTLFKGTQYEKTIFSGRLDALSNPGYLYSYTTICGDISFEESIEVELNYNQGEYVAEVSFRSIFPLDSSDYIVYEMQPEGRPYSVCDIPDGERVELDAEVLEIIKYYFGFSEDQVLTTAFTEQVKELTLWPVYERFTNTSLGLSSVDFDQIATYFPNLEVLSVKVGDIDNQGSFSNFDRIGSLIQLTHLHIRGGQLESLNPLSSLTNLTSLSFRNNNINDASSLSSLTNLEFIFIVRNRGITDFSFLSNLDNLKGVNLNLMGITDLSFVSTLSNIEILDLSYNNISDISPLSQLVNLSNLGIENNNISDVSPLSQLVNLTYLDIRNNNISDVSPLSQLTNLISLSAQLNNISDISALSNLTSLNDLDLSDNSISDISILSNFTSLRSLYLYNNNIMDLDPLSGLTNLNQLGLIGNPITQEQVDELQSSLPSTNITFSTF